MNFQFASTSYVSECATRRAAKSKRSRCGTRSPSHSPRGAASPSRLTNTNPCQTATRMPTTPAAPPPGGDGDAGGPGRRQAEVVEVVGVLGADERAVEVVDPGVVRALETDG